MNATPALAIDLGGTGIKIGVVDAAEILALRNISAQSEQGLCKALPRIEDAVEACLDEASVAAGDLCGLGLAFAGLVDHAANRIIGSNGKYEDGADIDLATWANERWGLQLVLDNDARMAAVGEWRYGAGHGFDDLVVVTLGTGIGTGVILNGALLNSKRNRAGNLGGHLPLSFDSEVRCSCGNRACAEALASTWALQRDVANGLTGGSLAERDTADIGFRALYEAVDAGDAEAIRAADQAVRVWATLAVALTHAYDPDAVIFTGNIMKSADRILPAIREYVNQHAWTPGFDVAIEQGEHPGTAALLGAAYLAATADERGKE